MFLRRLIGHTSYSSLASQKCKIEHHCSFLRCCQNLEKTFYPENLLNWEWPSNGPKFSTNVYDAIHDYNSAIDICAEFGAVTAPLLARVKSSNDVIYGNANNTSSKTFFSMSRSEHILNMKFLIPLKWHSSGKFQYFPMRFLQYHLSILLHFGRLLV